MFSHRPRGRRTGRQTVRPAAEHAADPGQGDRPYERKPDRTSERGRGPERKPEVDSAGRYAMPRTSMPRSPETRSQGGDAEAKLPRAASEPWRDQGPEPGPRATPPRQADPKPVPKSLLAGRLPTAEICGHILYHGSATAGAVVVGLYDAASHGTPLEYWVELDGPGPYVLDGIRPGRYELHACLTSGLSASGLPKDILATGFWNNGQPFNLAAGDIFESCDIELYDETPRGLLQGIDTVFYDVTDLESSVAFYKDVLGLRLTLKERSWAEFDTGSSILALRRRPQTLAAGYPTIRRGPPPGGAIVVFRVVDLENVRRDLASRGVRFIGRVIDIPESRWITFQDPDGNRMQLFERKR